MIKISRDGKTVTFDIKDADVLTNITVSAKKNTSSTTKFKGGYVEYKEKV